MEKVQRFTSDDWVVCEYETVDPNYSGTDLRSDYERFAKDYPDPPYEGMMPRV